MDTLWRRPGLRGRILYTALAAVAAALVSIVCHLSITRGTRRLPDGPVILVANHTSFADGLILALTARRLGRPVRMLATAGVFAHPVLGPVLRRLAFIPVHRGTAQAQDSLRPAAEALRVGETVGLFPEGRLTRDPGQWPERAKTGAVRLALQTGAPVVPIAIDGAHRLAGRDRPALSLLRSLLVLPRVRVVVGEPIQINALTGPYAHDHTVRWASDVMMGRLVDLLEELRGEEAAGNHLTPAA